MSKEIKALTISMTINFFIPIIKITGGVLSSSKSMIADGFHSFSDFITDIIAIIGSKISKKRANKKYPFGYGRVEYITDIFISFIIFILGIYTIINSFDTYSPNMNLLCLFIILITIFLKLLNAKFLMQQGQKSNSPILITSSKESFDDVLSSIGVIVIIVISQFTPIFPFLKYADIIGSIIIGLLITKTAIELLKENIISLVGQDEEDKEIKEKVKNIVNNYKKIKYKDATLIKNGSYYQLILDIECAENMRVNELIKKENLIKKEIKSQKLLIKFIEINIVAND